MMARSPARRWTGRQVQHLDAEIAGRYLAEEWTGRQARAPRIPEKTDTFHSPSRLWRM